jgi:response regulator NasT
MAAPTPKTRLRVLIANQRPERLDALAAVIRDLGHEVVAQEIDVTDVGAVTARVRPDLALVGLGEDAEHAQALISGIVSKAFCPVIALIPDYDADWIEEAARRGIFAYVVDARPEEIQSAIDIALSRYIEHASLQGAFEQREETVHKQVALVRSRQKLLLEVQDGILQQLTVASLGLQVGELEQPLAAVENAIERAKAIVNDTVRELLESGSTLDDVMRDSVPARV